MSQIPNSVLRIFLSSTAIDMQEHRQKVTDALLRLDNLPVKMEAFGAIPNSPVEVCKAKVIESNALVVMLAHRYGWVPTVEEGGDGKKSITWIEVETALQNNKPVFAFIVDDTYGWVAPKEQDSLTKTTDEKRIAEIVKNVQSLNEFKEFLNSKAAITRDKFTTSEVLALNVSTSLSNWNPGQAFSQNTVNKRVPFTFRIVHHLQPAPHFRGRKDLLEGLIKWWQEPVTPDRVCSLVAIGGTGKTAIVERFLNNCNKEELIGSVLVWSFYDDPNTDAFLDEACIVFAGEEPKGAGGKLEKLQRSLASENSKHLIVLDGLERIQSEGKGSSHAKGELEDHRLRNLLRAIAGGLGNTRALITSRFKLTDLNEWDNAGYKSYILDILDKETSIEVLRAWEIKGDDIQLSEMVESVGRHALSVSVLGSYLNHYCNCNPNGAKEFKLNEISPDEPLAARLGRILGGYAKSLTDQERDLLVRLSLFPKGVSVEILGYLINAGSEIAGALIGIKQQKLLTIAEQLKRQGLIYSYNNFTKIVYTAHPFLRDYFRLLLGVKPEEVHKVVRNKLAIGLDTKPENKPIDTIILDKYENLIEHSVLAGYYQEAYDLYYNVMGGGGGDVHLLHTLADYGRMIRIFSYFTEDGTPQTFTSKIDNGHKAFILANWGLAAMALGDLKTAEDCFFLHTEIRKEEKSWNNYASGLQNIAVVNIQKALFISAKNILEKALSYIKPKEQDGNYVKYLQVNNYGQIAYTFFLLGEIKMAREYFLKATELLGKPLYSYSAIREIEYYFAVGEKEQAIRRSKEILFQSKKHFSPLDKNLCYYMLGILALPESLSIAREHLQDIREWTEKSGNMESTILSNILASEIAYCASDYSAAIIEATTGLNQAEDCGYEKYVIDILLILSKIHLNIPDYKIALSFARKALDKSTIPDCSYAWGQANGTHLCGVCHKALGEYELARQRFEKALIIREKIQHPETEETRKLLAELSIK